jgi:uncharacterized membrane protein
MRKSLLLLCILLILPLAFANGLYADVIIELDASGYADIQGTTNAPNLVSSSNLTSKKAAVWTFTATESFEEYLIEVRLPKNSVMHYVKSEAPVQIGTIDEQTFIRMSDSNDLFNVTIQYSIEEIQTSAPWYIEFIGIIAVLLIFSGIALLAKRKATKAANFQTSSTDTSMLSERQKRIVEILESKKEPLTQTQICEELNLPKSSVSRNIETLVQKDILEKSGVGMSNKVRIKPKN